MKTTTDHPVSQEEIRRRIDEYRRLSFARRAPAVMVYPPSQQPCPWADCETNIAGMAFQLDKLGDSAAIERWLTAWWQGSGLVGHCPGCQRLVLFGYEEKRAVADAASLADALLPENWFEHAHIVPPVQ